LYPLFLYVTRQSYQGLQELRAAPRLFRDAASVKAASLEEMSSRDWLAEILLGCLTVDGKTFWSAGGMYMRSGVRESKVEAFAGMAMLAEMNGLPEHEGEERRLRMLAAFKEEGHSAVSRALACIGAGRSEQAIAELEEACEVGHPLMVWLHLWPIFDPLRSHSRFKTLIKKMKLP
jgi:hypothetical protein